jgi:hypothetical protein
LVMPDPVPSHTDQRDESQNYLGAIRLTLNHAQPPVTPAKLFQPQLA